MGCQPDHIHQHLVRQQAQRAELPAVRLLCMPAVPACPPALVGLVAAAGYGVLAVAATAGIASEPLHQQQQAHRILE